MPIKVMPAEIKRLEEERRKKKERENYLREDAEREVVKGRVAAYRRERDRDNEAYNKSRSELLSSGFVNDGDNHYSRPGSLCSGKYIGPDGRIHADM